MTFGIVGINTERAWYGVCQKCGAVHLRLRREKTRHCNRVYMHWEAPVWSSSKCRGDVKGIPGQRALRAAYALGGEEAVVDVLVERGVIERPPGKSLP